MKIELKKIKILEPPVKIKAGFRTINGGGDEPIKPNVQIATAIQITGGIISEVIGNADIDE
ncbi:MAG: hypothetical protein IKK91_11835 [Ruminococcus sp.]|nr:hypothetical protein [Ruminococcus sp.]